jgi:tRNA(fMet)-specific endonuclease VapC
MPPLYLLDANAISDAMKRQPNLIANLALKKGTIITSVIVQGEIRCGLELLPQGKRRADLEARASLVLNALGIEPVTEMVAARYAAVRSSMEKQGLSLGDNDLWIAATALTVGTILVTRDQAFSQVPQLLVEDWTK